MTTFTRYKCRIHTIGEWRHRQVYLTRGLDPLMFPLWRPMIQCWGSVALLIYKPFVVLKPHEPTSTREFNPAGRAIISTILSPFLALNSLIDEARPQIGVKSRWSGIALAITIDKTKCSSLIGFLRRDTARMPLIAVKIRSSRHSLFHIYIWVSFRGEVM